MPKRKRHKNKLLRFIKRLFILLFLAQLLYMVALKWVNPPITITMLSNRIALAGMSKDFHREWVDYEEISRYAKLAVIAGEDQKFPVHHGFDVQSIETAWVDYQHGEQLRGASTISQQTAKNVFLWQGGGWFRKGLEAYCTFMIELIWGKQRILEVYLNVAQMGDGIYGVEAAAQYYFHTSAKDLTRAQAALLAASLPNPLYYTIKPLSGRTRYRQQWILKQMSNLRGGNAMKKLLSGE
ncbi:MAG TPA: monofunctional biosynthetic peptidoglycan transglycosylase [Chitinophagaceae bacterium]|nr:monofunctional biosynthetic peptidoglycan transglycosylase [Chitinophagaceae bacterium]